MPLTFTGRSVTEETGHPSLIDIAVGLSRQPRFAGQTRRWWSVLDHSLFCDALVVADGGPAPLRLAVLLHDAHEAVTADVPTPFKTVGLNMIQSTLDRRITDAFFPGGWPAFHGWHQMVKNIDKRALRAEAWYVGPPTAREHPDAWGITDNNISLMDADVAILRRGLHGILGFPPVTWPAEPTDHPAVQDFLNRSLGII